MYLTETDPTHTCTVAIIPASFDDEVGTVTVETTEGVQNDLGNPADVEAAERLASTNSRIVGRYRLKRCLGRGTTGSVWNAEDLEFAGRDVALKLMHADMHDEYVLARYTCEVRALARMDDPHIARIWENGRTSDGKLYIAMELVQGIQLTKYCETWSPTLRERISLVIKLCRGMQHAHQRGILHRDLKPANILVAHSEGEAHPKIIDFGLAKSIHQPLMPGSVDTTQMGCLLGTIGYMSPEQASTGVRDVDTRSDVYSICVILYELLAGSLPVPREELNRVSLSQALDMIQNRDTEAASRRVQRYPGNNLHAARCQLTPQKLTHMLQGDLDAILEKGLTKERTKRYQSAGELADDLERYLTGGVVQARRRTYWYLTQKLLNRHWKLALSVLTVSLLFLVSWVGMALGLYWAVEARDQAEQAKASLEISHEKEKFLKTDAEMSSEFLEKVLTSPHPNKYGSDVKLLEALDLAKTNLLTSFANHPRAETMVRLALGRSYLRLGRTKSAQEMLEPVFELTTKASDGLSLYLLQAENLFIQSLLQDQRYDIAEKRCQRILEQPKDQWLPRGWPQLRSLYQSYARLLAIKKKFAEAIQLLENAETELKSDLKEYQSELWSLRGVMASIYAEWADTDHQVCATAIQELQKMVEQAEVLPDDHPMRFHLKSKLGSTYFAKGDIEAARICLESLLGEVEGRYGETHMHTQVVATNLSKIYVQTGLNRQAKAMFKKMLAAQILQFGLGHELTQTTLSELMRLCQLQGNIAQALFYGKQRYQGCQLAFNPSHIRTLTAKQQFNDLLVQFAKQWMLATAW